LYRSKPKGETIAELFQVLAEELVLLDVLNALLADEVIVQRVAVSLGEEHKSLPEKLSIVVAFLELLLKVKDTLLHLFEWVALAALMRCVCFDGVDGVHVRRW